MAREPRDPREGPRDLRDERRLDDPADRRDPRVMPIDARDERLPGDTRDERTVVDLPVSPFWRNVPASIVTGAYAALGLSLLLQPDRWDRTPAYKVLLDLLTQRVWGSALIVIAAVLGVATWLTISRTASIVAHLVAIAFTGGWMVAFIVRWLFDPTHSTTPMNGVTWLVLLSVLIFSMATTARYRESINALRKELR